MDLLRAWAAGAAVWLVWAVSGTLLHLGLLPLGAFDVLPLRLGWVGVTTLTGYLLVALAADAAHPRSRRDGRGRRGAAVWSLPAVGVPLEGVAHIPHPSGASAADMITLATAVAAIAAGTVSGSALAGALRARTARRRRLRKP
ncbi:hypothetical protein [Streptomonospora wellingtoniae]|uniref:Uncharacterized protein n=1 Tax=Streptomonospora wellingtoniae TaxID=3075544 RepID=A0ABU2KXX9_9ACTN|nr:hypothetical protein [Streptomonospora sp. DSM 45055]MDT0304110.1 hypothetical protein [Streptomonospora sp. DSM 45055]